MLTSVRSEFRESDRGLDGPRGLKLNDDGPVVSLAAKDITERPSQSGRSGIEWGFDGERLLT